ncbi:MAG: molybdopterin molybdotransferase MoeA [Gemmatimonadota bacterium]|nr:molybdopterin molybdotransferase MoeA [Gemmatimonadota bacterium]MDE3006479.1 molybdopterin molybdotransferase MoeA [Gemmatimonadota bacterium]MDE3014716.1 molybdopterin molybdotransferase MoeA [Gemmatimonadota bacterium]
MGSGFGGRRSACRSSGAGDPLHHVTGSRRGFDHERREADWLPVREARRRILASASPLPAERVRTMDALGRALSAPILATVTLPPWDNSAMDGYAVRAADVSGATRDTPVSLPVAGVIRAGGDAGRTLEPGTAIRIMTGAPVPIGADSVIRVEHTDREAEEGQVRISSDADAGRHVRAAGQDMTRGATLFEPGHSITAGTIGVLAAAGLQDVDVHASPRIALLPTGDELRRPDRYDDVIQGLGVPESNGTMLTAMSLEVGAQPLDLGIALDDPDDLTRRIAAGAEADVLVTIGGASMGEADLVKRVLDQAGFELDFWRVSMRPGSPISFGWLDHGGRRQAVFGLPGNPSSAFVTFEVFVRPYLLRLAGHRRVFRRTVKCTAAESISTPAELTYFQRVAVSLGERGPEARLTGPQLSGLVRGLALADGLAIIPPDRSRVDQGDDVSVMLLDTGPASLEADPA